VREPGGTLIEMASDGPGFLLDETLEKLGSTLFVPPDVADQAEDIKVMLPQFGLPDQERVVYRDLIYTHRFYTPEAGDGRTLVLFHGTGGSETDLMPIAHRAAPQATLLGLRGRATEDGTRRWFRGIAPVLFDQKDIRFEATAITAFMEEVRSAYDIAPERMVGLGYSNGANFLAATLLLQPDFLIRRAVLLRPVLVLDVVPEADLTGTEILIVTGQRDAYRGKSEELAELLRTAGARVTLEITSGGHELGPDDTAVIGAWLKPQ
jgi:phospholipase/carboxylesterase